jgi:two-component system, NarL family, sensor histidine kinase UhpB
VGFCHEGNQKAAKAFFDYRCDDIKSEISWWNEKVHPLDREVVFTIMQNFLRGKQDSAQAEYRFRCADGSYRSVFNWALLLRDENNAPFAAIGAMMDITERYLLQEELLTQQINHQKQLIDTTILAQEKEKNSWERSCMTTSIRFWLLQNFSWTRP